MNYLERAYTSIQKEYSEAHMVSEHPETDPMFLADYMYFDDLLTEKVFPMMLKDGGSQTEHGVLYRGFEYRPLSASYTDEKYYKGVIEPAVKELAGSPSGYSYIHAVNALEDFSSLGFLKAMTEKEMHNDLDYIMDNYICSEDPEMCEGIDECIMDYFNECIDEDSIEDWINRRYEDTGWSVNVFDDVIYSKDFLSYIEHLSECSQLYAFDGNDKVYLPALMDGNNCITFAEIESRMTQLFSVKIETNLVSKVYNGDYFNPPEYDDKDELEDITEYLLDYFDFEELQYYADIFQVGILEEETEASKDAEIINVEK